MLRDGPRASHLNPDAPRAIERWNGHRWGAARVRRRPGRRPSHPVPGGQRALTAGAGAEAARLRHRQAPRTPGAQPGQWRPDTEVINAAAPEAAAGVERHLV
ncbi:DUF6087 family protein [Streptomyces massasporeus]|uniref:DUF6087 family protein n=1 Tax=Streptomyces massasporeus TaxID=67324 RepID=UPI00340E0AC2